MNAQDIIDSARKELIDLEDIRWPLEVKLGALNDALLQLALVRPDATEVTEELEAEAGQSRQTLPVGALRLIDVPRLVDGGPLRRVDRSTLDGWGDWHSAAPGTPRAWVFDDRRPTQFYLYPPPEAGSKLEVSYSKAPEPVTSETQALTVADVYRGPLRDWVLYRCYSVDSGDGSSPKAQHYHNSFYQSLGVKLQSDALISPRAEGNS